MSKVITFSRTFPAYHPKAGEPTYFVEKVLNHLGYSSNEEYYYELCECTKNIGQNKILEFMFSLDFSKCGFYAEKYHTIRAGNRWKVGDKFSPRVWSGKPYRSPMIIIAPDIEVKKVWDFEIEDRIMYVDKMPLTIVEYRELVARNDGLSYQGFQGLV